MCWLLIAGMLLISQYKAASVQEAYEAFRSLDPDDRDLIQGLYHTGSSLFRTYDNDLSTSLRPSLELSSDYGHSWISDLAPTDDEYDSMAQHSWSGYFWSWVPGTSSWSRSGSTAVYKYRPIRLVTLIGTEEERKLVVDAVERGQELSRRVIVDISGSSGTKREVLQELGRSLSSILPSITSFLEYIDDCGESIRQQDFKIHFNNENIPTITGCLNLLSNKMLEMQVSQQKYFDSLGNELDEFEGDPVNWNAFLFYCPSFELILKGLKESFSWLQSNLAKQIKYIAVISDDRANYLLDLIEKDPVATFQWIKALAAIAVTCPDGREAKARMTSLLSILGVDDLIEIYGYIVCDDIIKSKFMHRAIIETVAERLGLEVSQFKKLLRKAKDRMDWAVTMAESNLLNVSDEETDFEFSDLI